jgi:hypothetical protein
MYRSADPEKDILSFAYTYYDIQLGELYVLVLSLAQNPGSVITAGEGETYFKVLVDGKVKFQETDQSASFQWIGLTADGLHANGWTAYLPLAAGTYELNIHNNVEDSGSQTSAIPNRECFYDISDCTDPNAAFTVPMPSWSMTMTMAAFVFGITFAFCAMSLRKRYCDPSYEAYTALHVVGAESSTDDYSTAKSEPSDDQDSENAQQRLVGMDSAGEDIVVEV